VHSRAQPLPSRRPQPQTGPHLRDHLGHSRAAHPARHFAADRVLLHQGASATRLLIMLDGHASAVVAQASGARSRYPLMTAPCAIDKAAVLAGETYPATWVATAPGRALALSDRAFWALLREQSQVREHVLRYLARQVGDTRTALVAQATGSAVSRLAHWLFTASQAGVRPIVRLLAGQQGIAEELGLSRVTVNRALQRLARAGTIRPRSRAIVVLDPVGLAAVAGSQAGHPESGIR
jgi:CRP/FNR family transcriptional regulator, cyclic AMP receptor protein